MTETRCSKCGQIAAEFTADGWCGECDWYRQRDAARDRKKTEENEARRQAMLDALGAGAVERFTFEKFETDDEVAEKALRVCREFSFENDNVYLCGITGSGKTHLACAIAMKAFEAAKTVHFFPSGPALSRWTRGLEGMEEDRRIDELARVDVLVINELGIGRDTEYSIGIVVEVIDRRIMRGKNGLVITSNLHPTQLAVKMNDARLQSRFIGLCKIIETGKFDFRQRFRKA